MTQRIRHPQWRKELEPTGYPFSPRATLVNAAGDTLPEGVFLDAALYPVGGQERLHLANVNIAGTTVTLTIGDAGDPARASGSFAMFAPPTDLKLLDSFGRPAGLFVSEPSRLAVFSSWTSGDHPFTVDQSEFVAGVCIPTPEVGLRGIVLDDGSLLSGEVWLVGDDGVVLSVESQDLPDASGRSVRHQVIRIDIVGDPLFRRRLCASGGLFTTPNPVRQVRVVNGSQSFTVSPDEFGDLKLAVNNRLAPDTVLRVRTTPDGVVFEAVGSVAT